MNHLQWEKYGQWCSHNPEWNCEKSWCCRDGLPKKGRHRGGSSGRTCGVGCGPRHTSMAWMHNHQTCYDNEMIDFWPLLCPLTDGGGTVTCHLACHLLSTWEWSSATYPTSCPPAPTNMEIRRWLPLDRNDHEVSREDLWTEAYACCLQCIAKASTGRSWVAEGEGMTPCVSPLTQAFLSAMGRRINPATLWECWPRRHDIVPRQPTNEIQACITRCLDQVAMRSPSNIAWDIFTWPDTNKDCWGGGLPPLFPRIHCGLKLTDAGNPTGAPWQNG